MAVRWLASVLLRRNQCPSVSQWLGQAMNVSCLEENLDPDDDGKFGGFKGFKRFGSLYNCTEASLYIVLQYWSTWYYYFADVWWNDPTH